MLGGRVLGWRVGARGGVVVTTVGLADVDPLDEVHEVIVANGISIRGLSITIVNRQLGVEIVGHLLLDRVLDDRTLGLDVQRDGVDPH